MPNRCFSRRAFARASLASAIALAGALAANGHAHAMGRSRPTRQVAAQDDPAWRTPHSRVLALAALFEGQDNPTPFREAWCRDFVNMVLERAGYQLADRSHLALAALRLGRRVADPRPGDLAVMFGHVTFFAGWASQGSFFGLGGNQSHRVTVARFARRAVIAFVRVG